MLGVDDRGFLIMLDVSAGTQAWRHIILKLRGLCMSQLPTGTVTLLFTDIEGSTLLLQQLGEHYANVLSEYRDLLRTVFCEHHGHEVDTQGDGFFVVFVRTREAIQATVAAQRALSTHSWPEDVVVRVRMGLHTGEPSLVGEGYVGLDVHYAARIMQAAHGGQVLLSQTTHDLVEHDLPFGVSLRDLGKHRLKDLQRPAHLYQLVIVGLPADFPPLRTLDSRPNNLPVQLTPLIGREKEGAAILNLLQREDVRLVTLTGPGGTGKTRLGLQVAAELSDLFADGVYFVNLAPLSDPDFVVPTVAQTLDIKEIAGKPLLDLLKAYLRDKHILLLLDNFEQVASAAVLVTDLLAACPHLKVIATSRAVLHVRGEQEFPVPPLAVPDPKRLPDLVTVSQYEAVELFLSRAQAVEPEFHLNKTNAPAIAEICVCLDGLPLAIELAAARSKLLPPQALLARLSQRLAVLTSGPHDAPARQQTLRNTIAWSYNLLEAQEQRLFRRLSVFVGGCTLEAIEAIYTALETSTSTMSTLDCVAALIDKSMLQQTEQEGEQPRLVMLETIREYGLEALQTSGEMEGTRRAQAVYYLRLAEEAEPELKGPQQAKWLERLEREHENLRAAMLWLLEQAGDEEATQRKEMALRLGVALRRFWMIHGHIREGRSFLEQTLAGSEGVTVSLRAMALSAAAGFAFVQSDYDRAEELCQESLVLYRELGNTRGIAYSLYQLGELARTIDNPITARMRTEEALALWREVGDKDGIAWSLYNLGVVVSDQGEYARACALVEESLAMHRASGNKRGIARSLFRLAWVLLVSQGDPATARSLLEESLALTQEVGDKEGMAQCLSLSGRLALSQGDTTAGYSLLQESMRLFREIGGQWGIAESLAMLAQVKASQGDLAAARTLYEESLTLAGERNYKDLLPSCLEDLAAVVAAQGDPVWAARLWGAAETLREVMGTPIFPVYRADYERLVAAARTQLGEQAFAAVWAEGRMMTPEQALAAQGKAMIPTWPTSATPTKSPITSPDGLSMRELEVLRLLATGLTDAQIAEQLVLSLHTVHAHLRTIYSKLGVTSRSAATRYAFEHQLV
jgi:predicted ATPase/class 3 adenylate cyclase/DNA-binding CsgD family transcriptional regulator